MDDKERRKLAARKRRLANRVLHKKTCPVCTTVFETPHSRAKYCSDKCYAAGQTPIRAVNRRAAEQGVALGCSDRACITCGQHFALDNGNQKRCRPCIKDPARCAPVCACGCGEKTSWLPQGKYAAYVAGHNFHKPGCAPVGLYQFKCKQCGEQRSTKFKGRKYCSVACYGAANRGAAHRLFKGGRTKYVGRRPNSTGVLQRTHRHVMQEHLGRKLAWHEIVHHIDHNGANPALENLFTLHCDRCHQHHHGTNKPLAYYYPEAHIKNGVTVGLPKRKPNQIGK